MKQRYYENDGKVYVKVAALFHPDGRLEPLAFWWEDGRRFSVDHVTDVRRAVSLKAGGSGIRYECTVRGKGICLFYEEDRWFMERKEAN